MRTLIIPVFLPELACPGRCIFCDQRRISGQREAAAPEAIAQIIESHLATNPRPGQAEVEVAFFGGTFTGLPMLMQEKYLQEAQRYIARGKVKKLRISTRPDYINRENTRLLHKYGVWLVEMGIQSLDDQVLQRVGRGYDRQQVAQAVKVIQDAGLQFGAQLMPGLPGSTPQIERENAAVCAGWGAATARIYPTLVLAGTVLERMYRQGEYTPLSLEEAIEISADMYDCFQEHDIPVIRVGLQASSDLEQPGQIIAGPWHPALGELVQSRRWRRRLDQVIAAGRPERKIRLTVPWRQLSQARGQHRTNLIWLQDKYGLEVTINGSILLQNEQIDVSYCE